LLKAAWTLAIETLSWIELKGLSERSALNRTIRQLGLRDPEVIGLAYRLVYETIRRKNLIDFILRSALHPRDLDDFRLGLRAFLRLYAYETMLENGGFEEAVNMAQLGRSILGWRELQEIEEVLGRILNMPYDLLLCAFNDERKKALQTSNPKWFVNYCYRLLGRAETLRYLESTIEIPPTYVRINTLKGSEEYLLKRMEAEAVTVEKVPKLQHTYKVIKNQHRLTKMASFRDGAFYIQDKASCLAIEVANPQPGETVLDVCAAPGAKTTYLAQLMRNKGAIHSIDYSKRRMRVWIREMKRMGVKVATPIVADANDLLPVNVSADVLILDPPCTGTGVFHKMPSAKWRLTRTSIRDMAKIQWEMLNRCAKAVKSGGRLVYSTCSIALEENEMLIERFLKWHPEFELVETSPRIGLPGFRGQRKCQRLYPHIHECNGFFVAKLCKEA
jgi:16S rRNA (cytosine967-C5)-methyltransferase